MKVGVIIGRFQVPALHPGHIHLLQTVQDRCDLMVVILGLTAKPDARNVLPFEVVMAMIREKFPDADFGSVMDNPGRDAIWSWNVDHTIRLLTEPDDDIFLYGSRDSFKCHYKGNYHVQEIPELPGDHSGTDCREKIEYRFNEDFRKGIFYSFHHLKH